MGQGPGRLGAAARKTKSAKAESGNRGRCRQCAERSVSVCLKAFAVTCVRVQWACLMVRDPVDRVVSEYHYLMARPEARDQDQWDYADAAPPEAPTPYGEAS